MTKSKGQAPAFVMTVGDGLLGLVAFPGMLMLCGVIDALQHQRIGFAAWVGGMAAVLALPLVFATLSVELAADAIVFRRMIGSRRIPRADVDRVELDTRSRHVRLHLKGGLKPVKVPRVDDRLPMDDLYEAVRVWKEGDAIGSVPGEAQVSVEADPMPSEGRLFSADRQYHLAGLSAVGTGMVCAVIGIQGLAVPEKLFLMMLAPVPSLWMPYLRRAWAIDAEPDRLIVRWPLRRRVLARADIERVARIHGSPVMSVHLGGGRKVNIVPGGVEHIGLLHARLTHWLGGAGSAGSRVPRDRTK
jgi:hypothetical protein